MARSVISYISDVSHLTFVTVTNPLHLLSTIFFYSMHLLGIILSQSLELLTLVLLDIIQHLINLFRSGSGTDASTA